MKNLVIRTLTGAVLLAIMIAAMMIPPYLFGVVFMVINMLCLYEFYSMCYHIDQTSPVSRWAMVGGGMLFLSVFIAQLFDCKYIIPLMYAPFLTGTFIVELFRKNGSPVTDIALSVLGHIYIALPFSLMCLIEGIGRWEGGFLLLSFFVAIWVSDTGAYLTGMMFGKHKLFERVSPKKSWEGFVGGVVLSALIGYGLGCYLESTEDLLPKIANVVFNRWHFLMLFVIVSVFGTLGDLTESLFKRHFKVKDSGTLLPGHGGFLDRFDSALIAAPFAYSLIMACYYI